MAETSKNPLDKKLDFLSGYQMVGGIIGLIFMVYSFFSLDEINPFYFLLLGAGTLLYVFSFISGLFLFQRRSYGLKSSLINQILQIIGFSFMGYGFEYVAGISFDIFVRYTDGLNISSNVGLSNWHILINNNTGIVEFTINVVAVFLVLFIIGLKKQYNKEISTNEVSAIGT